MILVGVTSLSSKKTGKQLMKLSFLDDSSSQNRVGSDVSTDFCEYNEDYFNFVGEEVDVIYKKSYNGQAVVDYIRRKGG